MVPNNNLDTTILVALGFTLLSLGTVSSILTGAPDNSYAQEDQEIGLLGGLEREQSDEAVPRQQPPADIGGSAPLNRTLVECDTGLRGGPSSVCITAQTGGGVSGNQTTATGGNVTTAGSGATSTTMGPGGIGTDDPSATDTPFSDLA